MSRRQPGPLRRFGSHSLVLGFRVLAWAVGWLPPWSWHAFARVTAWILWPALGKHRRRALANLAAQGLDPAAARRRGKACFRSSIVVLCESLAMPRLLSRRGGIVVEHRISAAAQEILRQLREGEILHLQAVSAHVGQWELAGAELARMVAPIPTVVSARLTKNPVFERFLRDLRASFGLTLVDKGRFLAALRREIRTRDARLYIFLCDQHFKRGTVLPFLGRPACTVPVPGMLVQAFQMPTLIGACIRVRPGHYRFEADTLDLGRYGDLEGAAVSRSVLEDINERLGRYVSDYPDQWIWAHRRWRDCCVESSSSTVC